MPSERFERTIVVPSGPTQCWAVLTDVERVAGWVDIVRGVKEIERLKSYEVLLQDQLGPFKLRADVGVRVVDLVEEKHIRLEASGRDRHVGTTIAVEAQLMLEPHTSGTGIRVQGTYAVAGTVATMGAATIRKRADAIMEDFFAAADRELASLPSQRPN